MQRFYALLIALVVILSALSWYLWGSYRDAAEERDKALSSLTRMTSALQADAQQAGEDAQHLSKLSRKVRDMEDYIASLEDATGPCLGAPDTDRLRSLWEQPAANPRRH